MRKAARLIDRDIKAVGQAESGPDMQHPAGLLRRTHPCSVTMSAQVDAATRKPLRQDLVL